MGLMNLNLDGVLTEEKIKVPADGILHLGHDLFKTQPLTLFHGEKTLTRGQDYLPYRPDERLYYQKNVTLVTAIKILNDELIDKELTVEYYACGDYIKAETWNEYPSSASLKQSLASKVDNSDYKKDKDKINADIAAEVNARIAADNNLQENLNAEKELRIAADDDLLGSINNEAGTRKTVDDNLQAAINAETTDRQTADSAIRADLENETDLRLAGDSNLQTQISDLKTKFESFVPGLTYKVVSALPTADILNDVIYLVPADSTGSQNVYNEYIYIDGNWELIGTTATTQAITVDSALSETSTNPVQNKVVTTELKSRGKVYTSLEELGLTAPVTVGEIFNAMPNETMAVIACEAIEEKTPSDVIYVSDVPMSFGILTIKKNALGRFSIEYQNSLRGSACNVKRWIGTLKGLDGTGLVWKRVVTEAEITNALTNTSTIDQIPNASIVAGEIHGRSIDTAVYSDALAMPIGKWRVDSNNKAKQIQNLPVQKAGILEVKYLQGNDGLTAFTGTYKYAMLTYTTTDGNIYKRSFNSDNTVGKIVNDTGWQKIGISNTLGLVTNSRYFKISITKNNPAWYGNLKFSYVYGVTPTEVDLTITSEIYYTITKGDNTIESITYTADGANITIGIKCTTTMYGIQTVEMPNEFGVINSLTEDVFTGDTTATLKNGGTDNARVTTLETQVSELFQSVSNGKTAVANAITGKGVSTSTTATFATMATNIRKIGGSKEETKSYNNTSAGITPIIFTFSANVLGIKQVIPPSDMAYVTPQTSANMFRIEGKSITIYVTGPGTWKVTALIQA